ncbi:MAG: InlB B-repeat-containing protein [Bacilli bacterium]|nr:InlB B-repeat-containing protein [Bacilli bacterium]
MGALATSCGGNQPTSSTPVSEQTPSSSKEKNYYVVTFDYNLASKPDPYVTLIVGKDETIEKPVDPEAENYIFDNWYKDPECTQPYLRWGLQIDSDFTLYANWFDFEDCTIQEKINGFEEKLASLGKDAVKVVQDVEAMVMYPSLTDQKFYVNNQCVYNRYTDITVKDYAQYQEDGSLVPFGQEQYAYNSTKFTDIYHDFEEPQNNEYYEYAFSESQINGFLSIDFQNLFKSCGKNILKYVDNPKYDEETFSYIYTGNFTTLNKNTTTYSYEEAYFVADYYESVGDYVSYQYTYDIGLRLNKGVIVGASVISVSFWAIGQEIQEYVEETSEYDFFYFGGEFEEYTGERFVA